MFYNNSIKYEEFLKKREEKKIQKLKEKEEKIKKIVALCNSGKTNPEICFALQMNPHTFAMWKVKIRKQGIKLDAIMGRPKQIKICPHCGGILS